MDAISVNARYSSFMRFERLTKAPFDGAEMGLTRPFLFAALSQLVLVVIDVVGRGAVFESKHSERGIPIIANIANVGIMGNARRRGLGQRRRVVLGIVTVLKHHERRSIKLRWRRSVRVQVPDDRGYLRFELALVVPVHVLQIQSVSNGASSRRYGDHRVVVIVFMPHRAQNEQFLNGRGFVGGQIVERGDFLEFVSNLPMIRYHHSRRLSLRMRFLKQLNRSLPEIRNLINSSTKIHLS